MKFRNFSGQSPQNDAAASFSTKNAGTPKSKKAAANDQAPTMRVSPHITS